MKAKRILSSLLVFATIWCMAAPAFAAEYNAEEVLEIQEEDMPQAPEGFVLEEDVSGRNNSMTIAKSTNSASNNCGENVTWSLSEGTLTISGQGAMDDYKAEDIPWYSQRSQITSVVVQSGVTHISTYAFHGCYNLTSVQLPNTVTSLGTATFYQCSSLTSVDLPAGVTEIPTALFADCRSLTSVSMPGVTSVGTYAFQNTSLTTFVVGKNLTKIDSLAFFGAHIKTFSIESGNSVFSAEDGILYSNGGKTLFAYPCEKNEASFTIPSTVTRVGDCAFANNTYLSQVTIPSSVTEMGSSAFQNTALTEPFPKKRTEKAGKKRNEFVKKIVTEMNYVAEACR